MKKIKYILMALLSVWSMSACDDYLDINNNPDNPNANVPSCSLRLKGIQANFGGCYELAGIRGVWFTQNLAKTAGALNNDYLIKWDPNLASCNWPNQGWFVYCGNNIPYLIAKAEETGAYHYAGAAKVIKAWGYMTMVDVYGEVPYSESMVGIPNPKFDSGKDVYYACMGLLDEALEDFQKQQAPTAEQLSAGDLWNSGNVDTWMKLTHGLKARWMLKLSKKADLYDPQGILSELEKAPQSNADNTIMRFQNISDSKTAGNVYGNVFGNVTNTTSRLTKWYIDLLTNTFTGGSGVEDPRTDAMVPSGEFKINDQIQFVRSKGIDLSSDIRFQGGPVAFDIYAYDETGQKSAQGKINRWGTTSEDPKRQGDSIYVPVYSDCLAWIVDTEGDENDDRYLACRYNGAKNLTKEEAAKQIGVISTGVFQLRADAPAYYCTYPEMCFIKAEVLYRMGRKDDAQVAYKNGIRAHMELMNEKLATYPQILGKKVIPEAEISAFLSSAAVAQNGAELKLSQIMQQKFLALSMTLENWNDMRRCNYGAKDPEFGYIYPDFKRPFEFNSEGERHYPNTTDPQNVRYWPRRLQQPSYDQLYNVANWENSNPEATKYTINSYPVWWDCATDEEYGIK